MSKLETNTIDNISGSSTLTIGDTNTSTIALKSGATLTNFPDMKPITFVTLGSNQSVTDNVSTVVQFDTVQYDPESAYNSSTYRFTPQVAGRYLILADVEVESNDYNIYYGQSQIRKNGSYTGRHNGGVFANSVAFGFSTFGSAIFDMNGSTDYISIYGAVSSHSGTATLVFNADSKAGAFFQAFRLIG